MTPADHILAGQLATQIGRPDLGVMIGRSAQANSLDAVEVSGFPPVRVPAGHESKRTFLHTTPPLASPFHTQALSHPTARGMMQPLPRTDRARPGQRGPRAD